MRNLNKPNRYNVASIQAQQTLGGDVMESAEEGQYVTWRDYKWLLESHAFVQDQWKDLDAENDRLKAEVERLTDALNKLVKTPPEATGGVRVKVDFWTQYGSRLPSSYETFWENAAKEGKPQS